MVNLLTEEYNQKIDKLLLEEITPDNINLKSFELKDELNDLFFNNKTKKMLPKVRQRLLKIADDFKSFLKVDFIPIKDIILTGSLANYNHSKYSDVDLHIILDESKVSKNKELALEYFDNKKKIWKNEHSNLKIYGFDVELYVQDINEKNISTGIYSLEDNKWLTEPSLEHQEIDKKKIKQISSEYINEIDSLESEYNKEKDKPEQLKTISNKVIKVWNKIKKYRKHGLSKKDGEFSFENIVFKVLRRSGHLEKLAELKALTYDKMNSLK